MYPEQENPARINSISHNQIIQQRGVLKIYSSSANTLITSCKWVEMLNKSEALNHIVNINKI